MFASALTYMGHRFVLGGSLCPENHVIMFPAISTISCLAATIETLSSGLMMTSGITSHFIQRYALRYKACVHAYALMSNHVHMLVQEDEYPLGRFMQGVQQSYTQYFNTRYGQTGHLLQGRYKANRIDGDEYLLALVRYIHLNPVKAGIVTDPADYQWSSHRHDYLDTDRYGIETRLIRGLMAKYGGRDIADYELLAEEPVRSVETNVPVVTIPGSKIRQGEASIDTSSLEQVADQVSQFACVPIEQLLG